VHALVEGNINSAGRRICDLCRQLFHFHAQFFCIIFLWIYSRLLDVGRFFSYLILYIAGRTPWAVPRRYLHTERHKQNKCTQISMHWVAFEPTIPAFKRPKSVHDLDGAVTVIGFFCVIASWYLYSLNGRCYDWAGCTRNKGPSDTVN
jgi:hypothetical protein